MTGEGLAPHVHVMSVIFAGTPELARGAPAGNPPEGPPPPPPRPTELKRVCQIWATA